METNCLQEIRQAKDRWEDFIKDLKLVKVINWMKKIQNRKEWKKVVEKTKTLTTEM